jgi:hypothetical protein
MPQLDDLQQAFLRTLAQHPDPSTMIFEKLKREDSQGMPLALQGIVENAPMAVAGAATGGVGGALGGMLMDILSGPTGQSSLDRYTRDNVQVGVVPSVMKLKRQESLSRLLRLVPEATSLPPGMTAAESIALRGPQSIRPGLARAVSANAPLTPFEHAQQALVKTRDNAYHATDLPGLEGIFQAGAIKPYGGDVKYMQELKAFEEVAQKYAAKHNMSLRKAKTLLGETDVGGVSFSLGPRLVSKPTKAITLVVDKDKLPPTRNVAEHGYQKTKLVDKWEASDTQIYDMLSADQKIVWNQAKKEILDSPLHQRIPTDLTDSELIKQQLAYKKLAQLRESIQPSLVPNPHFENEIRTFNKDVPVSAVKKILVDKEAYKHGNTTIEDGIVIWHNYLKSTPEYKVWAEKNAINQPATVAEYLQTLSSKQYHDLSSKGEAFLANYRLPTSKIESNIRSKLPEQYQHLPIEVLPSGRAMHTSPANEIRNSPLLEMLRSVLKPKP